MPLRAYAFMIIIGVVVAVWLTGRRLRARGTDPAFATDAAVWGVIGGIIGARIYHVLTSPQEYFGKDGDLVHVLYVWNGGLGIWGAVAGGALGVWLRCRRGAVIRDTAGEVVRVDPMPFLYFADAAVPGLILAQAIGRWGNYFNQELFGRPTTLPWGLKIDAAHRPIGYGQYATFHPTFLYESIWDLLVAGALLVIDRRHRLGRGRLLALYIMLYTIGRGLIEALRIDSAEHFLGLRLNDWTSFIVYAGGLVMFLLIRKPVDEDDPYVVPAAATPLADAVADSTAPDASELDEDDEDDDEIADGTVDGTAVDGTTSEGTAADGTPAGAGAATGETVGAAAASAASPAGAAGGDKAAGPSHGDA